MTNRTRNILWLSLLIIATAIGIALGYTDKPNPESQQHTCVDNTHQRCDGHCECDGLGCHLSTNNNTTAIELLREYQVELTMDSIIIYDGNRVVGSMPYGNTPIDSLFLKDNE